MNPLRIGNVIHLLLCVICLAMGMSACLSVDEFTDDPTTLEFSLDTLKFDTVFTDRGTATRHFKVYNRGLNAVRTDVSLGQKTPFFRMNVDGFPGDSIEKVEILSGDSIYVFIDATIDPHSPLEISPFIVEDYIIFNTGGEEQKVSLEAYGQDAIYLTPDSMQGGQAYLSCDLGEVHWGDEKPIILNGILVIDSCRLHLDPGTRLYVHGGVQQQEGNMYNDGIILIREHGSMHINGTMENPVVIQGDRLESEFIDVPGQWNGIRFLEGSQGNIINHGIIKNAIIGLMVDSLSQLSIANTIVQNSSLSNLYALTANVHASNSLFANSGENSVILNGGGNYIFNYVTMGNYGTGSGSLFFSNLLEINPNEYMYIPIDLSITNSIISAGVSDALSMSVMDRDYENINLLIEHTGIKSKELTDVDRGYPEFYNHFGSAFKIENVDKLFIDPVRDDYRLDTLSVAQKKAIPLPDYPYDLLENIRDSEFPDAGCYEYLEE